MQKTSHKQMKECNNVIFGNWWVSLHLVSSLSMYSRLAVLLPHVAPARLHTTPPTRPRFVCF